jgi:hypothetical protein
VIDSSAVQDRAFPWHAFRLNIVGELYFSTTYQLATAWDENGQCAFSGSGDGTIFYPGIPSIIGGTRDIPIESLRMKMIREGMEDYEYLNLVAKKDHSKALEIAKNLFPHTYESDQSPEELQRARDLLFEILDEGGTKDTDQDGVPDYADSCPSQRGTISFLKGCPLRFVLKPYWSRFRGIFSSYPNSNQPRN